jgi:hypothetical protein
MKIDSFVRGCLMAIVILLAMLVFRTSVSVKAAPTTQWLVVDCMGNFGPNVQNALNSAQAQGFQYVGSASTVLIFKK